MMFHFQAKFKSPSSENHDTSFYPVSLQQNHHPSQTYIRDFYTTIQVPFRDFSSPIRKMVETIPDPQNRLYHIKQFIKGQLKRVLEKFQQTISYRVGQQTYKLSIRTTPHFNINGYSLKTQFSQWLVDGKKIVRDLMEFIVDQFANFNYQFSSSELRQFDSIAKSMDGLVREIQSIWNEYLERQWQRGFQIDLRSEESTRES